jgi:Flp pilus assembly protein CpaB
MDRKIIIAIFAVVFIGLIGFLIVQGGQSTVESESDEVIDETITIIPDENLINV